MTAFRIYLFDFPGLTQADCSPIPRGYLHPSTVITVETKDCTYVNAWRLNVPYPLNRTCAINS